MKRQTKRRRENRRPAKRLEGRDKGFPYLSLLFIGRIVYLKKGCEIESHFFFSLIYISQLAAQQQRPFPLLRRKRRAAAAIVMGVPVYPRVNVVLPDETGHVDVERRIEDAGRGVPVEDRVRHRAVVRKHDLVPGR